jgi:hypothetical protein
MSRNEVATARANIVAAMPRELHPIDVLADFLGSGDFPVEIADPDAAAKLILERLNDAVQDRAGCAGGPDMIEISQEAQIALAELSKRKARERLHRDGASSIPAMQRRIKALAAERSIPPAEIAKLMRKRVGTRDAMAFCDKHKISMDWLLCGDLKKHPTSAPQPKKLSEEDWREFIGLVGQVEPRQLSSVLGYMRILAAQAKLTP